MVARAPLPGAARLASTAGAGAKREERAERKPERAG